MSTSASLDDFAEAKTTQSQCEFRAVIVYETHDIGWAAMELYQRLMEKFNDSYLFRVVVESFDDLEKKSRFEQSLKAAEAADMIFVGSAGTLPTTFLEWFNQYVAHRPENVPVALVDMTSETSTHAQEVHDFLRSAAKAHHLDLISKEQLARPAVTATTSSAQNLHRGNVRHWGINE